MKMCKDVEELKSTYANLLCEYAQQNENIVIVESDLMKSCGIDKFQRQFPERTFDVGVAEANMIGVAAGLSNMGKIPFTHTFAIFASHRCLDQIELSVAYAGQNVKMCGSDPGITTELNGGTHQCLDDVGVMRAIPNMIIFEPVDCTQLRLAFPQIVNHYGPVYIRLFRQIPEKIYDIDTTEFCLGKGNILKEGNDISIFATGIMVSESLKAAKLLKEEGIHAEVINMHTIKPLDIQCILKSAKKTGCVVTVENGSIYNGLGSAIAEVLSERSPTIMKRIGVQDRFGEIGSLEELKKIMYMKDYDIVETCKKVIERKRGK